MWEKRQFPVGPSGLISEHTSDKLQQQFKRKPLKFKFGMKVLLAWIMPGRYNVADMRDAWWWLGVDMLTGPMNHKLSFAYFVWGCEGLVGLHMHSAIVSTSSPCHRNWGQSRTIRHKLWFMLGQWSRVICWLKLWTSIASHNNNNTSFATQRLPPC